MGFISAFNPDPFRGVGMIDFAGSGVVHMTGGYTALIAAKILGARRGRFEDADGNPLAEPASFPAHSVALQVLGTFILWFGWYGFNPGSALYISTAGYDDVAGLCAVTTTLAAAAGAISALVTDTTFGYFKTGEAEYDLTYAMNGCLSVGLLADPDRTSITYGSDLHGLSTVVMAISFSSSSAEFSGSSAGSPSP